MDDRNDSGILDEKIKNIQEWNEERARIKPILETAVDLHNKARCEASWKNHEKAAEYFKLAIENYRNTLQMNPKYYLQDIVERVDYVIGEYVNNMFNLKVAGNRLKTKEGAAEFVEFIDDLKSDERKYIEHFDIAMSYSKIAEMYFDDGDFDKAYEFYTKVIDLECDRPFLNKDTYFKMGLILFHKKRFKEALVDFVSVLSFDRGDASAVELIDKCLKELNISEHRFKFLSATPNETKKLIMEVL